MDSTALPLIDECTLRPTSDWVLVEPEETSGVRPSGLIIPDTALDERRSSVGEVLAVGPQVRDVHPGDRLVFPRWAGTEVINGGRLQILMPAHWQLAVLEPEPA